MEQLVKKKQIIILAAGGLVTLVLVAAHYLSPISRRLAANEDVQLVLLNKARPMLFVYHPFSKTLNAMRLPANAARTGSAYQRASEILRVFSKNGSAEQQEPAYIEVSSGTGPDMDAFEDLVNTWRARPRHLIRLARYLRDLKKNEATDLSVHDLALLTLELSRLNSSNFIKEDFDKSRPAPNFAGGEQSGDAAQGPQAGPAAVRLEVLNASGKTDLARLVTKYLRQQGFDVIDFGTYGSVEKRTKIVNCSENLDAALRLREALGLGGLEIYSRFDKIGIVQARVILGVDFDETKIERGLK